MYLLINYPAAHVWNYCKSFSDWLEFLWALQHHIYCFLLFTRPAFSSIQEGKGWFCVSHGFSIFSLFVKVFPLFPCVTSITEVDDPFDHLLPIWKNSAIKIISWRSLLFLKLSLVSHGNILSTRWFCQYVRLHLIIWQFSFPEEHELWFSSELF